MTRLLAIIMTAFAAFNAAEAKPRAVSLDYCSDQYLLKLADPDQIIAVSRGSDKDYSHMRDEAAPYRKIRASVEEVFALEPDVVLRQWGGGANANDAFSRFGADVVALGYPDAFKGVIDNIRLVADALEQGERGDVLISELEDQLALLHLSASPEIRVLYVTPGGVTAGAGTMIHAMITAGGVTNIAAEEGKSYWPPLPAEELLLNPPQLIIAGFFGSQDEQINYWSAARHPAIAKLFANTPTLHLPTDLISCAAWYAADASAMIAEKAQELNNEH